MGVLKVFFESFISEKDHAKKEKVIEGVAEVEAAQGKIRSGSDFDYLKISINEEARINVKKGPRTHLKGEKTRD